MFEVYVIQNPKGTLYTGFTSNLAARLAEHNTGKPGNYTYKRGPWKLIHKETYEFKDEASKREKFLKSGKGREFIKSFVTISRDRAIGSSQGS